MKQHRRIHSSAPPFFRRRTPKRQRDWGSTALPNVLSRFVALGLTALLAGGASLANDDAGVPTIDDETGRAEVELLNSVELLRRDERLPPLERDFAIGLVARDYSRTMAAALEIRHGMRDPLPERVGDVAPEKCIFGENLARHADIDAIVDGWMASEGHRRNLLEPDFDSHGIGVVRGDDGFFYVTQILAGDCPPSNAHIFGFGLTSLNRR